MRESILASSIVFVAFLLLCTAIYYFLSYKSVQKSKKYYEELHLNIKVGKRIEFCNGIYGKIIGIDGDILEVSVSEGINIEVSRYAVTKIMN